MSETVTANGFNLDTSGQRIVVDPICRIEGHLRIEVNVDGNNVIRNAVSTGNDVARPRNHPEGARSTGRLGVHRDGSAASAPACTR